MEDKKEQTDTNGNNRSDEGTRSRKEYGEVKGEHTSTGDMPKEPKE